VEIEIRNYLSISDQAVVFGQGHLHHASGKHQNQTKPILALMCLCAFVLEKLQYTKNMLN
jgi:hypothetical protein